MTKPQGNASLYQHMIHIMGRLKPTCAENRFETSIKVLYKPDQFQHVLDSHIYGIGRGCHNAQY